MSDNCGISSTLIRDNCSEIVHVPIPGTSMLKHDEYGLWYLSMPHRTVGGIIERRLYGPTKRTLKRARHGEVRVFALLSSIMLNELPNGYKNAHINLHMAPATEPTHELRIHERRRIFKSGPKTVYSFIVPTTKGVIEIVQP